MRTDAFLALYEDRERDEAARMIESGTGSAIANGLPFLYKGMLPESEALLLASFSAFSTEAERELYISAFEASLNGFEIIAFGERNGVYAVVKGVEDGGGRMSLIVSEGLSWFSSRNTSLLRRVLLTGGAVIAPNAISKNREAARYLSYILSHAALAVLGGNGLSEKHPVRMLLDEGKEIALLRSSLQSRAGRLLVSEGCPLADSFASWYGLTRYYVYRTQYGRYDFKGEKYDSTRLY